MVISELASFAKATRDAVMSVRPLNKREQFDLGKFQPYLSDEEFRVVSKLVRQKKVTPHIQKQEFSFLLSGKNLLPQLESEQDLQEVNQKIRRKYFEEAYNEFAERAWQVLPQFIAPKVVGMRAEKQAAVLQLFCKDRVHILYFGDSGNGKTQILRSIKGVAPVASFGLASSGLAVSERGKSVASGLLPKADKGICCIDELNLASKADQEALAGAMEEGVVSYVRGGESIKIDAHAHVLAAATTKAKLSSLLPKFHLIFFSKPVAPTSFGDMVDKILTESSEATNPADALFIRDYVSYALRINPKLPRHVTPIIKKFATSLKEKESKLPYKITPRVVSGIVELAKASARMDLRGKVENTDLARVFEVVEASVDL